MGRTRKIVATKITCLLNPLKRGAPELRNFKRNLKWLNYNLTCGTGIVGQVKGIPGFCKLFLHQVRRSLLHKMQHSTYPTYGINIYV